MWTTREETFPHVVGAAGVALRAACRSPGDESADGGDADEAGVSLRRADRVARVLIVDDEPLIRWALKSGLEQAGFGTVEAGSGASALSELRRPDGHIDLVLLDLKLPDSHDLGLLQRIGEAHPGCPVLMMTAYATPDTQREALRLGARGVVGKPFNVDEVVSMVETTLR